MNQANKHNEVLKEIEESVEEAQVSHHILSAPTVGKRHTWRQKGTSIVCDTCESNHGFYINAEDIMTGVDKSGMPIIGKKF